MSRVIDPKLFAESLCKFHAAWLIVDTWNVVGLAVVKVVPQPPLLVVRKLCGKTPFPAAPGRVGGGGLDLSKAPSGAWGISDQQRPLLFSGR